jgi:hypothetical protein
MSDPRVTVILPTYNWATVLPFSIRSVLDQTFTDFELLVIGDACTDESAQVVASVDDRRVRWINLAEGTRHQAGPNNEGLRRARGEIVAYIGHDDLWLPRHLERLVAVIDEDHVYAHGHLVFVLPDAVPVISPPRGWAFARGSWIPPTALVHDRAVALDVGGWRLPRLTGSLDPEADVWARIFDRHGPPALVPCVTSVKLPAAHRPDVYRDRPCHEQATWLQRIRDTDDPERTFRSRYADLTAAPPRPAPALPVRAIRKLRRSMPGLLGAPPGTAQDRYRRTRRVKGVDD